MPSNNPLTFRKEERLCSKKLIDKLFSGGASRSMTAFPLRAVYLQLEADTTTSKSPIQVLISVPKKHLRLAVQRNRTKRQIREAYRQHKHQLYDKLPPQKQLLIALIWMDTNLHETATIQAKTLNLINRISERI